MYSPNDPNILWVAPHGKTAGNGSFEEPFGRIRDALSRARPGFTVVLKEGTYPGDTTIQCSGSIDMPIRIASAEESKAIILGGCWYLYDVSDLIVSGLLFRDAPHGAISVMGACERNRFDHIRFENCGRLPAASGTLFFGGSGAACNVVEFCDFTRSALSIGQGKAPGTMNVGLMVSEGDLQEGRPITNIIVRRNRFANYDYGILAGTQDNAANQYGHRIEYNVIDNCASEGIMVKCGDTLVKGNVVTNCPEHAISVATGEGSIVSDNRIVDCGLGIRVAGRGHTVSNNCIIRSCAESILIAEKNGDEGLATENIIVENNTCVGWSRNNWGACAGIGIEPATSAIVKSNLFFGDGDPCKCTGPHAGIAGHLIADNARAGAAGCEGVVEVRVNFVSLAGDNFATDSVYGASGWMCGPEAFDPDLEASQDLPQPDLNNEPPQDDESASLESNCDSEEVLEKSLLFRNKEQTDSFDLSDSYSFENAED
ncbi:MAG TPA: right-handed parallel beta-helix repeat-containing protein [Chitinivibrionales bacterium]|jgi:hypothetical protein|nr:right-handed parallel beta-helix repeat-containing protein [Chitinivibrionales bacterium]